MRGNNYKKMAITGSMWLFVSVLYAQYTVTGGGTPLLAEDDTPNRLQVYLVYGAEKVTLQYASADNEAHVWKRYRLNALEAEDVNNSVQNGTTSSISGIEEGYGYFVEEPDVLPRYVWIIDYGKYAFDIRELRVTDSDSQCYELWLEGEADMPSMFYYLPNGLRRELERTFEAVYTTLQWSDAEKSFSQEAVTQQLTGNPFDQPLSPPLCDTEITLQGDLFARHFNVEKAATTATTYQAVALEVHADTIVVTHNGLNQLAPGSGALSAPAEVHFEAKANTPVAALFRWQIYNDEDPGNPFITFNGESVDYTFQSYGSYTAKLEVTDRTTACTDSSYSIKITITDSKLTVPNAFSPGATPGINDEFKVSYQSIIRFKGWIFNRWGVEMYHWTDPNQGWDGKKGGKYVPPGVYFYVIEAKGSDNVDYKLNGHINIIRPKE
ncbi:MAG: gliding motility-associated C-terminal domain-containing protein [Bacteroidales bacterium]